MNRRLWLYKIGYPVLKLPGLIVGLVSPKAGAALAEGWLAVCGYGDLAVVHDGGMRYHLQSRKYPWIRDGGESDG